MLFSFSPSTWFDTFSFSFFVSRVLEYYSLVDGPGSSFRLSEATWLSKSSRSVLDGAVFLPPLVSAGQDTGTSKFLWHKRY